MNQLNIAGITKRLRKRYYKLLGRPNEAYGPFEQRIRNRYKAFWRSPEAEIVRNTPMAAADPLENWRDVEHWQRKLSNKHNAREFAKMHGCRVPELYWKGKDHTRIDFGALPDRFVIRPTIGHSSGLVFLMKDGVNLMDKKRHTPESIRSILGEALQKNPYLEFLIEEFVRDETGEHRIPDDYKIYMFNGELAGIQVINRLGPSKGFTSCYDEDWNRISNVNLYYPRAPLQQAPDCLQAILDQVRFLSKTYEIFVRIDFYATDKGAVFGEFTPTPFMGTSFTAEAENTFVAYWDKFCKGMI